MTYWAEQRYPYGHWDHVEKAFSRLYERMHHPPGMMLVSAHEAQFQRTRVLAGLPSPKLLDIFPGFHPIEAARLPRKANLIVADAQEFEAVFEFETLSDGT